MGKPRWFRCAACVTRCAGDQTQHLYLHSGHLLLRSCSIVATCQRNLELVLASLVRCHTDWNLTAYCKLVTWWYLLGLKLLEWLLRGLGWIVDWFRTNGIRTFQRSRVWLKPRKRMNRYEKEVTYHKRRPRSEFRNIGTCFQFETTRKLTRVLSDLSDPQAPVALWVLSSTLGYQSLLNRLSSHRSLAEEHEEPPIEILIVSLNCLWFSCLMLFHYLYISICSICVMIFYDILSLSSWISRLAQVCCNSWETTPCRSICWPTQCMTSLFIFFQRETRALTTSQAESGYVWVFFLPGWYYVSTYS